ncbi:YaaA family protein [Canibacter zhoujuaniae]|uniref:YaaA family protein n=1 Tax=Canibacter zhoujuaniae TaxID=2708343 RepID=UPI001422DAD7|nr:peroxide stress protein YaaA [Canibacter zhoujuaniae]
MLVLLPPSETKNTAAPDAQVPDSVVISATLQTAKLEPTHRRVKRALVQLSKQPDSAAHKTLKLKPGKAAEQAFAANRQLTARAHPAPLMPAILRYTGVVYDHLDFSSLSQAAKKWVSDSVAIQSALYGLTPAAEPIANYRLSAGSVLPELEGSLKRVWREAHAQLNWPAVEFVLDLRSNDYVALAPVPENVTLVTIRVAQRLAAGEIKALNHFNKAAKGALVRKLAETDASFTTIAEFEQWIRDKSGLEIKADGERAELDHSQHIYTLVTELGAPQQK